MLYRSCSSYSTQTEGEIKFLRIYGISVWEWKKYGYLDWERIGGGGYTIWAFKLANAVSHYVK